MRFKYQHPVVCDLAWAIASPPLMTPQGLDCMWYDAAWYQNLYNSSLSWFDAQDDAAEELQEKLDSQRDRRLGRYFETLWAYWLEKSSRYEVLEQNLPLRDESRTLGELDFLVLDKASGKCLHWEVAVKFYLGVGELQHRSSWHGPGKKDRLDLKVEHLRDRQSMIARRPQTQQLLAEKGYKVDACGVILKGRLFYPKARLDDSIAPEDANQSHLKSHWIRMSDLLDQSHVVGINKQRYSPLLGYGWMSVIEPEQKTLWFSLDDLQIMLDKGDYRLPLHLLECCRKNQYKRFFVVSDDWAKELCR